MSPYPRVILYLLLICNCVHSRAADPMHGRKGLSFSSSAAPPTYELQRDTISPDGQFGLELITGKEVTDEGREITTHSLRLVRVADGAVLWKDGPGVEGIDTFSYILYRGGGKLPPFAWSADSRRLAIVAGVSRLYSHLATLINDPSEGWTKHISEQFSGSFNGGAALFPEQVKVASGFQIQHFHIGGLKFTAPEELELTCSGTFRRREHGELAWALLDFAGVYVYKYSLGTGTAPRVHAKEVKVTPTES